MTYYWYIDSNSLKFMDSYGNDATLSPVSVKYRKRLYNEIPAKDSEETALLTLIHEDGEVNAQVTLTVDGAGVDGKYIYFIDPLLDISGAPNNIEDKYYVSNKVLYLNDEPLDLADYVAKTYSVVLLENLWEEQDDGLDNDLQLAALYFSLSRAADMVGGDRDVSKYFFEKYNYMVKDLRRKYNSSKYRNIVIKPYDY